MANAKNFRVTLVNGTQGEIKVERFAYEDGDKWKDEHMFGIDGHQKIEQGRSVSFTRDFHGIGNATTRFQVHFRTHTGGTKWSGLLIPVSGQFTAPLEGGEKSFTLNETSSLLAET